MKTFKHIVNSTAIVMLLMLGFTSAKASENGTIKLEVYDETKSPAMTAAVFLMSGDQVVAKAVPDIDAIVNFKEVAPGSYDIKVTMFGHNTHIQKGVVVSANKTSYVTITLQLNSKDLPPITIVPDKISLVSQMGGTGCTIDLVTLNHMPSDKGNVVSILVNISSDLQPTPDGKDVFSRGARQGTTEYLIDGEKVIGTFSVPALSIQGVTVYTGGVPACYGDFTGGLVMLTTKSYMNGLVTKRNMYDQITADKEEEKQWQEEQKKKNAEEKK